MPRWSLRLAALPCAFAACGPSTIEDLEPTVILVSLDGFRHDYADRAETPVIDAITAGGVQAAALVPVFPSKSYPNHVSLSTGLRPVNHGIVSNGFWDPELGERFSYGDPDDLADARWWLGEPIWTTAEKQGQRAAIMFWPGAQAPVDGILPSELIGPEHGMADADRVEQVLQWVDLPATQRPTLLTLYLSDADDNGHWHGPDSAEIDDAVVHIDSVLGSLLEGLEARGVRDQVDLVVVSDHGMADIDRSRLVYLDDHVDMDTIEVLDWTTVVTIWPADFSEDADDIGALLQSLADLEHAHCFGREDAPADYHLSGSQRVAPILCEAEEGWAITRRTFVDNDETALTGGNHGYDPSLASQQGVFWATGPHFAEGVSVGSFETIEVYGIVAHALGLEPTSNDGELSRVSELLAD